MPEPLNLVSHARRVITAYGEVARCVGARDGRIVAIEPYDSPLPGAVPGERFVELLGDEVLLPGLVDTHVHVNEPGRTEWEGFTCATRPAVLGGVTLTRDDLAARGRIATCIRCSSTTTWTTFSNVAPLFGKRIWHWSASSTNAASC